MKKSIYKILLVGLTVVGSWIGVAMAQQESSKTPLVKATISKDSIMIGDQPTITVSIDKDITQIVGFPEFDKELAPSIELIEQSKIDTIRNDNRRELLTKKYKFTVFEHGNYNMGKFPIMFIDKNVVDTIYSIDSLKFVVRPIVIDTTKQQIHTVKAPLDMPITFKEIQKYVWYGLLALVIIALIIYLIIRIKKHKSIFPERPKLPAHVTAINELEKIKSENLWQSGKTKLYYTRLTEVIREYLEERYDVNALEMTSDEILQTVKNIIDSKGKDYLKLKEILTISDLVKFAKMQPTPEDNQSTYNSAYSFIEQTKICPIEEEDINKPDKE